MDLSRLGFIYRAHYKPISNRPTEQSPQQLQPDSGKMNIDSNLFKSNESTKKIVHHIFFVCRFLYRSFFLQVQFLNGQSDWRCHENNVLI